MPEPLGVKKLGVILKPTEKDFENLAVLNPGCYQEREDVHLFYRAVDQNHYSSIGYARLKGPSTVVERWERPIIYREYDYESHGVEDPRIVKIDDTFYLFYVAHDGKNAVTALATSHDLKDFKKNGIITPQITYVEAEEMLKESCLKDAYFFQASLYEKLGGNDILLWLKDTFIFPRKINGKFFLVTRVLPDIQIIPFNNFEELKTVEFWKSRLKNLSEYVILENKHWFETRHVGGGCPPIETKDGWIFLFHAVEETNKKRVYHTCAALLDKENPLRVIGRLHEPLFSPQEEWETSGFVSNVVFATGTAVFGDKLYIYYGAADKQIAVAEVSINKLLEEMQDPTKGHTCVQKDQK